MLRHIGPMGSMLLIFAIRRLRENFIHCYERRHDFMENKKVIRFIKIASAIITAGVTLVLGWVEEKQIDKKINKRIQELMPK